MDPLANGQPAVSVIVEAAALGLLGLCYFLIAIFRSASAELNSVSANRLLAARGLGAKEGESAGDQLPVIRTTFDIVHHVVLIGASGLCLRLLIAGGFGRPFLIGLPALAAAALLINVAARALALSDPERAFAGSLVVMAIFYHAVRPVTTPVGWMIRRVRQVGRDRRAAAGDEEATDEQIEAFIDAGRQEGILEAEEGKLIRQVVEFHDSVVREVMTPRTEVVALPRGATVAQARALFAQERHSRIPVYRDQIDNVEGIITLKDLVASWGKLPDDAPVDGLMLPAYYVPETKQVSDLLREFQARRIQLAIVVDEYGGTAGVVSIEDLLEELVGEIKEEHEREEAPVVKENEGRYLALGTASLDDLRAALGVDLEAEGFETISGLIYSVLGRIPSQGETVDVNGLRLEVVQADTRKIDRVRVTRLAETKVQ